MGYKPSQTYLDGLTKAATYRPNQNPLIEALKDTIAYQAKIKAQTDLIRGSQSQQGMVSTGQMPVGSQSGTSAPGGQSGATVTSVQAVPVPAPAPVPVPAPAPAP